MTTHTFTGASGLRYTLRSAPAYLDTAQPATLTLTTVNPTDHRIDCPGISIAFPVPRPGHDTTGPTKPGTADATVSRGFTLTTGPSTYTATPTDTDTSGVTDQLTVTLNNIGPPTVPGIATLHLTELAAPDGQDPHPVPVVFWPAGDEGTFDDFHPDDKPVHRGETTTLHWRCAKNPDIAYTLYYNTDNTGPNVTICNDELRKPKNHYYTTDPDDPEILVFAVETQPLFSIAIGYHLQASYQGGDEAKYQTTASFIIGGDLDSGDITVKRNTRLFHTASRPTVTEGTVYTAPTDGVLFGSVTADAKESQTLTIQVQPRGAAQAHVHTVTSDSDGDLDNHSFTIPVGKYSALRFTIPSEARYYKLIWQPIGDGDLTKNFTAEYPEEGSFHFTSTPHTRYAERDSSGTTGRPTQPGRLDSTWPAGDQGVFEDFHPDDLPVRAGATTNLNWHCSKNEDIEYGLYYNTTKNNKVVQVQVDDDMLRNPANNYFTTDPADPNLAYFTVPTEPLDGLAIGYHLRATHKPSGQSRSLTTASVITAGDLTVGNLTVCGSANILHTSQDSFDSDTPYTAPTDGFVFAALNPGAHGTLQVTIVPLGAPKSVFTLTAYSANTQGHNRNFTLPVRRSSTVEFTALPDDPSGYHLSWFPLGAGKLV